MLSYSKGPDAPLIEETIAEVFRRTVARVPDREALVVRHQNVRWNFAELAREVERTASGLAGLGLRAADRVGVWSTNCAEWVLLHMLAKSGMKALVLWDKDARSDYAAILLEAMSGQDLALKHVVPFGTEAWDPMRALGTGVPEETVKNQDVVNIQYTSGTTGSPKGVLLTHRNLLNNAAVIANGMKITEADRLCVPVPLYHCFGCVIGTLVSVLTGATLILPAATFDPLATMQAIAEERATANYGVPTMFISELGHAEFARFDFSSLRTGVMAGAPCPMEVMKRVVNEMHCPQMTIMYGQTESSPVITSSGVDDSLEHRVSTVGRACPNTEVKIVSDSGETVPAGEQGELCTRGYLVMKGYDQEPEATRRAIDEEGWLHTGDLGVMRPDGYFRVTGRAKDMIIRGG